VDFLGVHDDMGHDAYKYILVKLVATCTFCHQFILFWQTTRFVIANHTDTYTALPNGSFFNLNFSNVLVVLSIGWVLI
jgi:hypothetical protein